MEHLIDVGSNWKYQNRKSILTKLVAGENVDVRFQPSISTAEFDLKNRVVTLPLFKEGIINELQDLFIIHESGHATETPPKKYVDGQKRLFHKLSTEGLINYVFNVVEDIRINEIQKDKFPGSRRDFRVGYKSRWDRGDYGVKTEEEINKKPFLDRINMNAKIGHVVNVVFDAEENEIVSEAMKIKKWPEVEEMSEKIMRYLLDNVDKMHDPKEGQGDENQDGEDGDMDGKTFRYMKGDGKGNGTPMNGDVDVEIEIIDGEEGDGEGGEGDEGKGAGAKGTGDGSDGDGKNNTKHTGLGKPGQPGSAHYGDGTVSEPSVDQGPEVRRKKVKVQMTKKEFDELFGGKTVEKEQESTEQMIDKSSTSFEYVDIPVARLDSILNYRAVLSNGGKYQVRADIEDQAFNKWFSSAKKKVNHMINIFEMKKEAEAYRKALIHKTGVIDTNRIHYYRTHDDIFLRNMIRKDGKNHGFIFLLDTSGSMGSMMGATKKQAAMMALFARKLSVPFQFLTFSDVCYSDTNTLPNKGVLWNTSKVALSTTYLTNVFDSSMGTGAFNQMLRRWVSQGQRGSYFEIASGGTPLNSSLLGMHDIAMKFMKDNKVDILNIVTITDGDAGDPIYPISSGRSKILVFVDPVTKRKYQTNHGSFKTMDVLNMLRDRLAAQGIENANLVNFFLVNTKTKEMNNEGRLVVKVENEGYDDSYIIHSDALDSFDVYNEKSNQKEEEDARSKYVNQLKAKQDYKFFLNNFAETISTT